ncbi:MAG TPA: hypothetical protein H9876_05300 [Candidatus Limosilactobacillus merdipullorum]|uniref:Uncharacterized protein n=1 Tax=Candidatus Limosilactobacillus merdipullorum TaxID=2838653 RepID=A0A9D1QQ89_9LACO|nr:hypothetical protein [Candidatus Limosilactobacillus merdipullorum]
MIGFLIALVGALMLAFANSKSSIAYVVAAHVILMIGCPLAMSPSQTSALNSLTGVGSADGSTILNTMQQVVGALTTAIANSFLELCNRVTVSFHFGIYFALVLTVVGLMLTFKITDDV